MFLLVLLGLVVVSVIWAYFSYTQLKNIQEVSDVKEDLKQGKVIFHSDSLPSAGE